MFTVLIHNLKKLLDPLKYQSHLSSLENVLQDTYVVIIIIVIIIIIIIIIIIYLFIYLFLKWW